MHYFFVILSDHRCNMVRKYQDVIIQDVTRRNNDLVMWARNK